jgi:NADP-dependent 3-hydroxy acid dehydrogenase YdfG
VLVEGDVDTIEETARGLKRSTVLIAPADVISEIEVASVFEKVIVEFNHVDCLINVAGVMSYIAKTGDMAPTT